MVQNKEINFPVPPLMLLRLELINVGFEGALLDKVLANARSNRWFLPAPAARITPPPSPHSAKPVPNPLLDELMAHEGLIGGGVGGAQDKPKKKRKADEVSAVGSRRGSRAGSQPDTPSQGGARRSNRLALGVNTPKSVKHAGDESVHGQFSSFFCLLQVFVGCK
jgi:hypothetical protein